jgi:hypothetical protein
MKSKTLILGLLLAVGVPIIPAQKSNAQTPSAFNGRIYYHGEICHRVYIPPHQVTIVRDGGVPDAHRVVCSANPGYDTQGYSYNAGWYTFTVKLPSETKCYPSEVRRAYYNGVGEMQVDLNVYGDEGHPDMPDSGK